MAEYVKVIAADELPPGQAREVQAGGRTLALVNVDGQFHAVDNRCVHRGGPLGQGFVEGHLLGCPWHAWNYDVRTGEMAGNPEFKVACYPVRVEDGQVLVSPEPVAR
jgi:nitrite reductase/ring-hydroxylating ferredoxin subunit